MQLYFLLDLLKKKYLHTCLPLTHSSYIIFYDIVHRQIILEKILRLIIIFFFNKLKNSEITSFIKLISLIKPFIYNSKCDLWLAAIDFLSNNNMKYKIYVKGYDITIYDYLAKKFVELGEFYLSKQIVGYKEWISRHQELEQYGLAVCVDSNSLFTVNLYH